MAWPCRKRDAFEYYTSQIDLYTRLTNEEIMKVYQEPLGIAFVNLGSPLVVERFLKFHPRKSKNNSWKLAKAPSPDDINWSNLECNTSLWYLKAMGINFFLILFLTFLTTPALITKIICRYSKFLGLGKINPLLEHIYPSLILLIIENIMPDIVSVTDMFLEHWTKSAENKAVLHKTFISLVLVVLILPSLGLANIHRVINALYHKKDLPVIWECIFLPDSGAFFTNYLICTAWLKPTMHLLRIGDLFVYLVRLVAVRSPAEIEHARYKMYFPFRLGINYTHMLLVFTVSCSYSIVCPLVTPFGVIFLLLKRLVDKYNLFYIFKPITLTEEAQNLHLHAINLMRISIILLQYNLFIFLAMDEIGSAKSLSVLLFGSVNLAFFFCDKLVFQTLDGYSSRRSLTPHLPDVLLNPMSV